MVYQRPPDGLHLHLRSLDIAGVEPLRDLLNRDVPATEPCVQHQLATAVTPNNLKSELIAGEGQLHIA